VVFELLVRPVMISPDGGFLQCAVHPLDLAIGPRVVWLGQAMLDALLVAGPVEGMAAPHGRRAGAVLRQVGELDAVVREHGMDLVGDGRDQLFQERPGALAVARFTSRAKAYFEVRSTATKRCSLPSSVRTSAMSMWK
jgi:hypothetical protein